MEANRGGRRVTRTKHRPARSTAGERDGTPERGFLKPASRCVFCEHPGFAESPEYLRASIALVDWRERVRGEAQNGAKE
jgi:hypothetical protein